MNKHAWPSGHLTYIVGGCEFGAAQEWFFRQYLLSLGVRQWLAYILESSLGLTGPPALLAATILQYSFSTLGSILLYPLLNWAYRKASDRLGIAQGIQPESFWLDTFLWRAPLTAFLTWVFLTGLEPAYLPGSKVPFQPTSSSAC